MIVSIRRQGGNEQQQQYRTQGSEGDGGGQRAYASPQLTPSKRNRTKETAGVRCKPRVVGCRRTGLKM